MNAYNKLVNNSIIFAIGNLGSKLIYVLLLPVYTYYLSTAEFGNVDLITTTITMLLPIVSFSVYEAVLRYAVSSNISNEENLTNSLFLAFIGIIIFTILMPVIKYFNIFNNFIFHFYILLILQIFERLLGQFSRGIGQVNIFAINGILLTFTTGILNILFLVIFDMGIQGYLLSMILAYIIAIVFLLFSTKSFKYVKFKYLNFGFMTQILKYSIPLVPNTLMWWLINASSRFFIVFYLNLSANGLFAVASRIPSVLGIASQIFSQAWQLSAIEEYENSKNSVIYSSVLNFFISVLFICSSFILLIIKPLNYFIIAPEYYDSWRVMPFLLVGIIFSSLSGYFGAFYIASKETKGVFMTSIYGGIISLVLNITLIPIFGIVGAGLSSMFSFFAMSVIRYRDSKKYIKIKINSKNLIINLLLIFIQIFILFMNFSVVIELVVELFITVIILVFNRQIFKSLFAYIIDLKIKYHK